MTSSNLKKISRPIFLKYIDVNFLQITKRHMIIPKGIEWLSDFQIHHWTEYQYLRLTVPKRSKCSMLPIYSWFTVQYDHITICIFEKELEVKEFWGNRLSKIFKIRQCDIVISCNLFFFEIAWLYSWGHWQYDSDLMSSLWGRSCNVP